MLKFTGIVKNHYQKVVEMFTEIRRSYRPLIKMIQLFEVMLENFMNQPKDDGEKLAEILGSIVKGFKKEAD